MNTLFSFDSMNMVAWALVHFLWQGTLIGLAAWLLNTGFLRRNAQACYAVNVAMLCLLVACVPLTMLYIKSTRSDDLKADQLAILFDGADTAAMQLANEPAKNPPASTPAGTPTSASTTAPGRSIQLTTPKPTLFPAVVLGAYVAGLLVMLMRFAVAASETMRLRRSSALIQLDHLCEMLRNQARAVGLRAVPLVATCDELVTPIVIGLFRPMILLPTTLLSNISPSEVEAVLAHELAHIRRYDLWFNVFQKLAESLLFFHPAVWYINHMIDTSRELCCDEIVVRTGHQPLHYASALIRIAELAERTLGARLQPALALSASGKRPSQFKHRVMRLLSDTASIKTNISEMLCFGLILSAAFYFALGIAGFRQSLAADPPKADSTPESTPSQKPTEETAVDENLPKTPEEWKAYHAENKRKSIAAYNAHPFSKLLNAYIAQPKKEFKAAATFAWKGDRMPLWHMSFSSADETPNPIGIYYNTDGLLRMDMDYKHGTMQTYDNLRAKSFYIFLPNKPVPVPLTPRGTPAKSIFDNVGGYTTADIVNDAASDWMRGGATRCAYTFWPFSLHWMHTNLSQGAGSIKTFEPVDGQPNIYSLKLTFPPNDEYRFKLDNDQLQLVSVISTEGGYYGTQTREFENDMIDGVPMPIRFKEIYTKADEINEFTWDLDYSKWGGSRPLVEEIKIPDGALVNDQPGRAMYFYKASEN